MTIAKTAVIFPDVELAADVVVEDYCVIGARFKGWKGEKTVIGPGSLIRSHSVIYAGNKIGANFQSGNRANIRELNQIGDNVSIGTASIVEHHVTIGHEVRVHSGAFIPEYTTLEEGCWIGPHAVLTNAKLPISKDSKKNLEGPWIGKKAIIGANATVLAGLKIGECALVGAGSVVTKNVAPGSVVAGVPAETVKDIKDYGAQYGGR